MARDIDARRLPRGTETIGTCRECGGEFTYVYLTKIRQMCDPCQGVAHVIRSRDYYHSKVKVAKRQLRRTPMSALTVEQRLSLRPDHAVGMSRDAVMTKHDLQHAPTEDFARRVNQILQGERGLV